MPTVLKPDDAAKCRHSFKCKSIFPVQLDLPSSIRIKGGNMAAEYKAVQLHLHWGKDGGPGSEHTVDGEKFPMEVKIWEYRSVIII